jgi:hypothetical protein
MFHYRWHYDADIEMAGSVLPHYNDVSQPDDLMVKMKQVFSERQESFSPGKLPTEDGRFNQVYELTLLYGF